MDAIKWETKVPQLVRCGLAKYYEAKEFGWDFNGECWAYDVSIVYVLS